MWMAQVRQIYSLTAKLRQSLLALVTVAVGRGRHVQLFDSDKGIQFEVATLVNRAKGARTQDATNFIAVLNPFPGKMS
jgi:hypothetical protein